jgi:hypothetical protein
MNAVPHKPNREHKMGKETTQTAQKTIKKPHTLYLYTQTFYLNSQTFYHNILFMRRQKLTKTMEKLYENTINKLSEKAYVYGQPHPAKTHPIENNQNNKLYSDPYATNLPEETKQRIIEALPDSRWYRNTRTVKGMITIQKTDHNKITDPT